MRALLVIVVCLVVTACNDLSRANCIVIIPDPVGGGGTSAAGGGSDHGGEGQAGSDC